MGTLSSSLFKRFWGSIQLDLLHFVFDFLGIITSTIFMKYMSSVRNGRTRRGGRREWAGTRAVPGGTLVGNTGHLPERWADVHGQTKETKKK